MDQEPFDEGIGADPGRIQQIKADTALPRTHARENLKARSGRSAQDSPLLLARKVSKVLTVLNQSNSAKLEEQITEILVDPRQCCNIMKRQLPGGRFVVPRTPNQPTNLRATGALNSYLRNCSSLTRFSRLAGLRSSPMAQSKAPLQIRHG